VSGFDNRLDLSLTLRSSPSTDSVVSIEAISAEIGTSNLRHEIATLDRFRRRLERVFTAVLHGIL
jgi:hypothetical protein